MRGLHFSSWVENIHVFIQESARLIPVDNGHSICQIKAYLCPVLFLHSRDPIFHNAILVHTRRMICNKFFSFPILYARSPDLFIHYQTTRLDSPSQQNTSNSRSSLLHSEHANVAISDQPSIKLYGTAVK